MLSAKLLIPAVAALGLFAFSGTSKAANGKKAGADKTPPSQLLAKIDAAFKSADPAVLLKVADEAAAAGFEAQAADLRALAAKITAAIKATPVTKPPSVATLPAPTDVPRTETRQGPPPSIFAPTRAEPIEPARSSGGGTVTTLPEVVITSGLSQAERLLAGKMALSLRNASKGKEDKGLVSAFQAQAEALGQAPGGSWGSEPGKVDGIYGPKTAIVLARHYGIVPPKPLYWPKNSWVEVKKNYRAEMARFAAVDAARADEWTNAGRVL